jgi:hypothetical protein
MHRLTNPNPMPNILSSNAHDGAHKESLEYTFYSIFRKTLSMVVEQVENLGPPTSTATATEKAIAGSSPTRTSHS